MCSNDSPSVKPDGTTDAAELAAEYEEFLLDIEEQPLPEYRTDEIRVRIEEVRATLATDGVASAGQLQQLLRTVTEALADVRAAQVVSVPESRDLSQAVPGATGVGAAYEVTETEQQKATNVLLDLLFTVVETPPTTTGGRQTRTARLATTRHTPLTTRHAPPPTRHATTTVTPTLQSEPTSR